MIDRVLARLAVCAVAGALALAAPALATDYYVSPLGNDANPGTQLLPWKSIAQVNTVDLAPGDRVLFEGGKNFPGTLQLGAEDSGTPANPVTITSYGAGRATIAPGNGAGLYAYNCGGIVVRSLRFRGSGAGLSQDVGVGFFMDLPGGVKLDYLRLDQCDVAGFGDAGVWIGSNGTGFSGYRDVRVTLCTIHDNRRDGMFTWGQYTTNPLDPYSNSDFYIGYCKFYNNTGIANQNTGHGLYLKDVDGATIEYCEAYNNGTIGGLPNGGGPVGIWALQSRNVTIQYCESHHNRSGGANDGGGFDLDGGMSDSRIQYCYSHDNEGAGFLLLAGAWARPTTGNVVRFNVSENDGLEQGAGAFHVYGEGKAVTNTTVHNNTSYFGTGNAPAAVVQNGPTAPSNLRFHNNVFITAGGRQLVNTSTGAGMSFQGNCYWPSGSRFEIVWGGVLYTSFAAWHGTGQERLGGADIGFNVDPLLRGAGGGRTVGEPEHLERLAATQLMQASPMVDQGLDLAGSFGIDPGTRDFYGNSLPQGADFDVGAHERPPGNNQPPLCYVSPDWGKVTNTAIYQLTIEDPEGNGNITSLVIDVLYGSTWLNVFPSFVSLFAITLDPQGRYVLTWPGLGAFIEDNLPLDFRVRLGDAGGMLDQKYNHYWIPAP